jgi:adenylate cyclase
VYQNLLLSRRTELHERAGQALERATGESPQKLSDLEALAYHWSLAADKAKGGRYLMAAGDWARALYANEDAIRHYRGALRTLADCQACVGQVQAIREGLADLLALTGERCEALAHYEALQGELETAEDHAGVARLHRKAGGLHWEAGDRKRASACLTMALDRLG